MCSGGRYWVQSRPWACLVLLLIALLLAGAIPSSVGYGTVFYGPSPPLSVLMAHLMLAVDLQVVLTSGVLSANTFLVLNLGLSSLKLVSTSKGLRHSQSAAGSEERRRRVNCFDAWSSVGT